MNPEAEADIRKAGSIARLKAHDVPYIDYLPRIETVEETERRTPEAVGTRIICLALVSMKGAGADHDFVLEGVQHYGVEKELSPKESTFILDREPSENARLQFSWRAEAGHALLWAAGRYDELLFPSTSCDWNAFWSIFHTGDRASFLNGVLLRSQSEILDESDFTYRLHWAAREASMKGQAMPAGLNMDVVVERHHALNWLAAPADEPYLWDETPTDT
ncbi:DUF4272 domain-containing protein [Seohaeicola nanhaiensis]|uniref:DUF4272 domain-containing protein n=1 Tax=Seohaeicola nanhaiensis TaxID=1387282 RepID=A0ABV9KD75_9RHOB